MYAIVPLLIKQDSAFETNIWILSS
jgi:hypothetical protein